MPMLNKINVEFEKMKVVCKSDWQIKFFDRKKTRHSDARRRELLFQIAFRFGEILLVITILPLPGKCGKTQNT